MIMIAVMSLVGLAAYAPQYVWGPRRDWRMPMRHGMAAVFAFTGIDHFLSLERRYLPMMPSYLDGWAVELVLISGALELAGALGLVLPLALWSRLGLPNLRPVAGIGLAMLLAVMVIANGHVATIGATVEGLPSDPLYYATRPLFQPLIVLWALVCSGAVYPPRCAAGGR